MTAQEVGFVGIGRMGAPIAGRLLEAGHALTVYDPNAAAVAALVARGATAAPSPAAVASAAETVLLSLPTPAVVTKVALGPEGLIAGDRVRRVIDLSTSGAAAAKALAEGLGTRGIATVDCPVSGGVAGARKGTLALMVSCRRPLYDELKPLLECFGKPFFIGEQPGMAQTMKVINNLISVTTLAVASEALVLGTKAGLDPETMIEVINSGTGRSNATTDKIPSFVLTRSFDFGFAVGLSCKDIKLCVDEGAAQGVPMVVGNAVLQLLGITKARFGEEADMTRIIQSVEEWAGVEVKGKAG